MDLSPPAAVLTRNLDLIQSHNLALDIACGKGSNALFLASLGISVHAWDISNIAVDYLAKEAGERDLDIQSKSIDITPDLLPCNIYDLVLNCHYLDRNLVPAIASTLKPGGLIFFQTFTIDKLANIGPDNPKFLLRSNELIEMFLEFEVLRYQDGSKILDTEDPLCGRAFLIARKPKWS